jgi:hypothetical protein
MTKLSFGAEVLFLPTILTPSITAALSKLSAQVASLFIGNIIVQGIY